MDELCINCKFVRSDISNGTSDLYCHKNPPQAGMGFPLTSPDDWCGEWKTKPTVIINPARNISTEGSLTFHRGTS